MTSLANSLIQTHSKVSDFCLPQHPGIISSNAVKGQRHRAREFKLRCLCVVFSLKSASVLMTHRLFGFESTCGAVKTPTLNLTRKKVTSWGC